MMNSIFDLVFFQPFQSDINIKEDDDRSRIASF